MPQGCSFRAETSGVSVEQVNGDEHVGINRMSSHQPSISIDDACTVAEQPLFVEPDLEVIRGTVTTAVGTARITCEVGA